MFGFGKPKCEFCGSDIKNNVYEKDGKKFHSRECADNFRKSNVKNASCCH